MDGSLGILGTGGNIVLVLIGFGLLVAIHEFGHFIAAKWAGVRVDGFAVGMGPVVLAFRPGIGIRLGSTESVILARTGKRAIRLSESELGKLGFGETEYSLRLLPLGGFVRMLGQDDLHPGDDSDDARSYTRIAVWKRMVIVSAGVTCNIILAIAMFVVAFMIGVRFEAPIIGTVVPSDPAAAAGLRVGDRVLSIDGTPASTFADVQIAAAMSRPDAPMRMVVERTVGSQAQTVDIDITARQSASAGMMAIGVGPAASTRLVSDPAAIPFLYGVLRSAGFWNHAPDGMSAAENWGVPPGTLARVDGTPPDLMKFEAGFQGADLIQVAGAPANTYSALDEAAARTGGQPIATRWSLGQSNEVNVALNCVPVWQILEYTQKPADAFIDYEQGLLGLSPLVKISRVPATSLSTGILHDDDVVLRVADIDGPRQMEFRLAVQQHAGKSVAMRVLRAGQEVECEVPVSRDGKLGVEIAHAWETPLIARPFALTGPAPGVETAVASLDLMPLSRLTHVDGKSVGIWSDYFRAVKASVAKDSSLSRLSVTLVPPTPGAQPETLELTLTAEARASIAALRWRPSIGPEWFMPAEVILSADGDPLRAAAMGFHETKKMVLMTYLTLDRLLRGTVGVSQLRGPVGIVHIGTRIADRGMTYLVFFLAMISVNLAVINFLPIPIADGGLMVFLIYERLRGKPPSPRFQNGAMMAGLVLVGLLFAVTFYNDVLRLVG